MRAACRLAACSRVSCVSDLSIKLPRPWRHLALSTSKSAVEKPKGRVPGRLHTRVVHHASVRCFTVISGSFKSTQAGETLYALNMYALSGNAYILPDSTHNTDSESGEVGSDTE